MIYENSKNFSIDNLNVGTLSEDEVYELYIKSKLQKSQDDIKNGRVITLEELDKEREELYESYSVK